MALFSPVLFLTIAISGAAWLLLCWRASRRFGWAGLSGLIVALSGQIALWNRFLWDPALNIVTVGIYPLVTEALLLAVGFAIGYAVMRLIAGPASNDRFARKS